MEGIFKDFNKYWKFIDFSFNFDEEKKQFFLEIIKSYKDDENNNIYDILMEFDNKRPKLYNCITYI